MTTRLDRNARPITSPARCHARTSAYEVNRGAIWVVLREKWENAQHQWADAAYALHPTRHPNVGAAPHTARAADGTGSEDWVSGRPSLTPTRIASSARGATLPRPPSPRAATWRPRASATCCRP